MSVNIRYPNITGFSDKEQLGQIKSYLHQLVEQLNWALPNLGAGGGSTQAESSQSGEANGGEMTYYELRSLVMQELHEIQNLVDTLEAGYVKNSGWSDNKFLSTDDNGNVIARKLTFTLEDNGDLYYEFTLEEDGNLYYEVEE